ncbi:MAG: CaiB/BaiF CoA transferase family protein [Oscillospiraceae bacterium]
MATGPLSGVKVIEYCSFVAGPYGTKLLADLGAEVIKIEPPEGDEARKRGPFKDDVPNPETSAVYLYNNTNKLGVTLNLESAKGREIFKKLIADADIFVEDKAPGKMASLGLGYDVLKEINPGLIMMSITPFGQTGPYKDFKAYYLTTYHASGSGYILPANSPDDSREPIKGGGYSGESDVGSCAAVGLLGAMFYKNATGKGQYIDLSKQEAMMNIERMNIVRYYELGKSPSRVKINRLRDVTLQCGDGGYIKVVLHPDKMWRGVVSALGTPEWTKLEQFSDHHKREENYEEMTEYLQAEAKKYKADDLFKAIAETGTACAPIASAEQVYNSDHTKARKIYTAIDHPVAGTIEYPAMPPFKYATVAPKDHFAAPTLGQHNEEVFGKLGYSKTDIVKFKEAGVI